MKARFFLIGLVLIFLTFILSIWYFSYEELTYQILHFYGKEERLLLFRSNYLTLQKFTFLRYSSILLLLILLICFSFLEQKIRNSKQFIQLVWSFLFDKIKESISILQNLSTYEKYLFWIGFILTSILKIYFWLELPFFVDEAFSFLFFVDKGFLVTTTYYPGPNNHILYNLFANFCALFFQNGIFIMRLPSFLLSSLIYFIGFILLKKITSTQISLLSVWILNSYFLYNFYAISGRGYILYLLCFIFCLYSFYQFKNTTKQYYVFIYAVFSVLGLYTIPTFVYPLITFFVIGMGILLTKKQWFITHIFIGFFTIICYLPIFLVSGVGAVTNNNWVKPLSFTHFLNQFFDYLMDVFTTLLEFEKASIILFLLLILISFFVQKGIKKIVFWMLFFLIPFSVLLIQQVLPFSRIWIYLLSIQSFWIAFLISHFVKRIQLMWFILLFLMFFSVYKWKKEFQNGFGVYDEIPNITAILLKNNPQEIYIEEDTYNILSRYAFQQKGKNVLIDVDVFDKNKEYDFILLTPNSSKKIAHSYQLIAKNKFISLYQKQ